ncbi:hypothetical protein GW17_00017133 [Ensete ventricosum]|nr:hypothetical protein GW17_00017133 [Ensete ventricosum]
MPGAMAAPAAAKELPVEPQSLKKLSLKSLKRALDLFSPIHGHHSPPDPQSKRIRISYKVGDIISVVSHDFFLGLPKRKKKFIWI